jgi:hypothetical protein
MCLLQISLRDINNDLVLLRIEKHISATSDDLKSHHDL